MPGLRTLLGLRHLSGVRGLSNVVRAGRRCLRLTPEMVRAAQWRQEDVAENIKRLRIDWCSSRWRDAAHRFVPVPAGPRVARVRVAPPMLIGPVAGESRDGEPMRATLLWELRQALQRTLDALLEELAPLRQGPRFSNPFLA